MKKKLLLVLSMLTVATAFAAVGCNMFNEKDKGENNTTKTYTVTFKQAGEADKTKKVEEGKDLTDIPSPVEKEGYTIVWEDINLTNITGNLVVNAIATANSYTITYNANGGVASMATQKVVYDSTVTLATATYEGYDFQGWTLTEVGGTYVQNNNVWKIAKDVTLVANWTAQETDTYTVTFRQNGVVLKVVTLDKGTSLTDADIPEFEKKTGYYVKWDEAQLNAAKAATEGNFTVDAVEWAKTYTLNFMHNSDVLKTVEIEYGDTYSWDKSELTKDGYTFKSCEINGDSLALSGTWTYDNVDNVNNVIIVVNLEKNTSGDSSNSSAAGDDGRDWTPNF